MNYKIYLYLFPDGKAYVGMTKNSLEERRDMGYQHNKPLQRAIRKYGWHGFEHKILVDGLTVEEAYKLEKHFINMYQTTNPDYGYNVSSGGKSTYAGLRHTKEYKQRMSEINKGKVFSEEHKKHLKESHAQYCKKVICLDSNKNIVAEYESLNQAARTVNGHPTNVKRACVSGKKYQTYFWALAEREEVI